MFDIDPSTLMLAQDQLPLPGEGGQGPGTVDPSGAPGGGPTGPAQPFPPFFMIILLVVGAMILFSIMGQRRDRKKRDVMLSALRKHDKVQTLGGVIGSIVEVKADSVVLKVDESTNTRITFARSSIQHVLSGGPEPDGVGSPDT